MAGAENGSGKSCFRLRAVSTMPYSIQKSQVLWTQARLSEVHLCRCYGRNMLIFSAPGETGMNLSFDGDCKGDQFRFTPGHTRIPNTHWGHKPCMRLRLQVRSFLVSALINVIIAGTRSRIG